ncbi:MAG TPA: hypothetical protein VMZ25_03635, partial [Terriglobales bacterium]|nr:hypothetical protein [Terriglobales bacterium]
MRLHSPFSLGLAVAALVLFPSSVPGQAKPDAPPVFKASSSLVTVNVIVTDRFQQPVTGLTAKD